MKDNKKEIQFPCRWEFRLFAAMETLDKTKSAAAELGKSRGLDFEISVGESSASGKYTALRVACQVDSIEQARELAGALGKLEGVRFLL